MLFLFAVLVSVSAENCILEKSVFKCENIVPEDFLYEFHSDDTQGNISLTDIIIRNSNYREIIYFPKPTMHKGVWTLQNLEIVNSNIHEISKNAFMDYFDTDRLNLSLSNNFIKNIDFVENMVLHSLNVSHCKLEVLNFDLFTYLHRLRILDVSHNKLIRLQHNLMDKYVGNLLVNLNHNNIVNGVFNFQCLLPVMEVQLQQNSVKNIQSHCLMKLDLSGAIPDWNLFSLKYENNLEKIILSNNRIVEITNNILKEKKLKISSNGLFDLSNCSLQNICLEKINMNRFNLNGNRIEKILLSNIEISVLNLSNSYIRFMQNNFSNAHIKILDLSKNKLEEINRNTLEGIFGLTTVDFSENPIAVIRKNTFSKQYSLQVVRLINIPLKTLELKAFDTYNKFDLFLSITNLKKLDNVLQKINTLYLYNVSLDIQDNETFVDLPLSSLKIEGKISTIRSGAFRNLSLTELILTNLEISSISENSFTELHYARLIDLSFNKITSIPRHAFHQMASLKYLNLSNNPLVQIHKATFSFVIQLSDLSLTFHGAFYSHFLSRLYRLENLRFINSNITNIVNESFVGMYNLQNLIFINSTVANVEMNGLKGLFNLKELNVRQLFYNKNVINENSFRDLHEISRLNMSFLNITVLKKNNFEGLINLNWLSLRGNHLKQIDANVFSRLNNLQHLDLSKNELNILNVFDDLPKLKILNLNHNKLQLINGNVFKNLKSLKNLTIQYNTITNLSENTFYGLQNLVLLSLQHNDLIEMRMGIFQHLHNLEVLNLQHNRIKYLHIGLFSNLKQLLHLNLSHNEVSLLNIDIFFPLRKLIHLDLAQNHIIQVNHTDLVKILPNLKVIDISHNKWRCETLFLMLTLFEQNYINFTTKNPVYNSENIAGIECIDICKFLYCPDYEEIQEF